MVQGNCKIVRSAESLKAVNLQMSLPFMAVILEDYRPTPKVLLKHFRNCFEYIVLDIFNWFHNVL